MAKDKFSSIWQWLTEPNPAIQTPENRFQARLIITLMLILVPFGTIGILIPMLNQPGKISKQSSLLLPILVLNGLLLIGYLMSRSRHYKLAIIFTISIGVPFILLMARLDESPEDLHVLYYLTIIVLVGTLFLSLRATFVVTAVTLAAMLSTPLFIPQVTLYSILTGPFNLVLLTSAAFIWAALYRSQLEKFRQQQMSQLINELAHRADQLTALHQTALDILSHSDLNDLLQAIIYRAARLLNVVGGAIYLVDPDGDSLTLTAIIGPGEELKETQLKRGEGMAGQVLATGQPMLISNDKPNSYGHQRLDGNLFGSIVQVPMIVKGEVIGVLSCQEALGIIREFTPDDIELLQGLARQGAIALQNAYLFTEEQSARDRAERLQAATQALSSTLVLPEVLEIILVELQKVVPYDSATVQQLKAPHHLEIIGGYGFPNFESLLGMTFDLAVADNPNKQVIETRSPFLLDDAPAVYDGFKRPPHNKTVIRSWMGIPLLFGNQTIGMLALDKKEVGFYSHKHAHLASAFAAQAAIAIENARLYEETRQHAFELETLAQISASLRPAKSVPEMLPILLDKTIAAMGASFSVIFLLVQETGELVSRYSSPPGSYPAGLRQPPGSGITGYVAATRELHISENVLNDPLLSLIPGEQAYFSGTQSMISAPLQTPDQLVGVVHVGCNERRSFSAADARLLTSISNIAANALIRATVMDTLEERVAERTQELKQANARLQELDSLKTKFIADISHELRTPVATLNLYMDLLERGKNENKSKYMGVIRQKTDLLVRLTEDILNVSRLNLYEGTQSFTAVDLNKTVAVVLAMHQDRAQAADISLTFIPAPDLPPIHAERNQLMQAISNVLANALNYTPAGSVTISTYLDENGCYACLEISDTGIGINSEEIPHVFERFYRGRNVAQSNIPGTGLGLAIVKEIVNLHKGFIELESQLGIGTTQRIKWPLADK